MLCKGSKPLRSKGTSVDIIDPDHELMAKVARGDTVAYRTLVNRHLNGCVRFAQRMVGNRQDAEDIVQDVCLKLWHEAPRWQPKAKLSTWLYRVLFNACIDHKRKVIPFSHDALEEVPDTSKNIDDFILEQQEAKQVKIALEALPPRQRAAVLLSYYEERSNQDAADIMQMSLNAFQQLLFRARQQLKDALLPHHKETHHG